jgi:hypothetical protein
VKLAGEAQLCYNCWLCFCLGVARTLFPDCFREVLACLWLSFVMAFQLILPNKKAKGPVTFVGFFSCQYDSWLDAVTVVAHGIGSVTHTAKMKRTAIAVCCSADLLTAALRGGCEGVGQLEDYTLATEGSTERAALQQHLSQGKLNALLSAVQRSRSGVRTVEVQVK